MNLLSQPAWIGASWYPSLRARRLSLFCSWRSPLLVLLPPNRLVVLHLHASPCCRQLTFMAHDRVENSRDLVRCRRDPPGGARLFDAGTGKTID